jgi:membrane-bound lytic murein transglycosylase A
MAQFPLLLAILTLLSCARSPIKDPIQALRKVERPVQLLDSLGDEQSFEKGLESVISYLVKVPGRTYEYENIKISGAEYALKLRELLADLRLNGFNHAIGLIQENFDLYEVYGQDEYGEILLTSYYAPVIKGSTVPTSVYTTPLHTLPSNVIEIDLKEFDHSEFPLKIGEPRRIFAQLENKQDLPPMALPLPSRKEIEENKLHPQNIICYVDSLDAFFLQIQGSGSVILEDGRELQLGYVGQNSRKYESIGKFLKHKIPPESMSMQAIESYLRTLDTIDRQNILNLNPSYVYFKKITTPPMTTSNTPVIAGRTLAVDTKYFPLGMMGFLKTPVNFNSVEKDQDYEGRFIFAQDTGGAIKGAHRADLYWGKGHEAAKNAGRIKHTAYLYFLLPKTN